MRPRRDPSVEDGAVIQPVVGFIGAIFGGVVVYSEVHSEASAVSELAGLLILSGAAVMGAGSYIAADLWLEGYHGGDGE